MMEGIKLSEEIEIMDSTDKRTISLLNDVVKKVDDFLSKSLCTPEMRMNIFEKQSKLIVVLENMSSIIKKPDISDEEKTGQIHELLGQPNITEIVDNIKAEIKDVKEIIQQRIMEASRELKKGAEYAEKGIDEAFNGYLEIEEEKAEDADQRRNKILKFEKERAKKEALIKYEGTGFIANFKKIKEYGRENPGKKVGLFRALIQAYRQTKAGDSTHEDKVEDSEFLRIQDEMEKVEAEIVASKENTAKLKEQRKELKKELTEACESWLSRLKSKYDKVIEPDLEAKTLEKRVSVIKEKLVQFKEQKAERAKDTERAKNTGRAEDMGKDR